MAERSCDCGAPSVPCHLFIQGKKLLAEAAFHLAPHLSYPVLFEHTSKPQAVIMPYTKQYIPLECNPEVFNEFSHHIGLLPGMEFQDVYSVEDPKSLVSTGCPVHALILVFHCSELYKDKVGPRKFKRFMDEGPRGADEVIWFKQTIQNASSFYAILHAICNDAHKRCPLGISPQVVHSSIAEIETSPQFDINELPQ